jgi:hypothetical protein
MTRLGIGEIFSFDSDFGALGFVLLPARPLLKPRRALLKRVPAGKEARRRRLARLQREANEIRRATGRPERPEWPPA